VTVPAHLVLGPCPEPPVLTILAGVMWLYCICARRFTRREVLPTEGGTQPTSTEGES
jgi:hypothetical protein